MAPKTLEQLPRANFGPFYAAGLYPKLAEIFRRHGYALAVHGSIGTDFDLIAVPWVDSAADPDVVAAEVNGAFAAKFSRTDDPQTRAHGRITYKLALSFDSCSLDISFTPRHDASISKLEAENARLRLDAARWRAVVGSVRVRVLGSAGLLEPMGDYAHIGLELWTRYQMPEGASCEKDRERFTQYADFAAALAPPQGKEQG